MNAFFTGDRLDRTRMPFVTRLTFQSGDRAVLDDVVEEVKERAERKGVQMRGPNPEPLHEVTVPQYMRLHPDGPEADPWRYTVYIRTVTIVGHDEFAREVAAGEYPPGIHLEADIEQVRGNR